MYKCKKCRLSFDNRHVYTGHVSSHKSKKYKQPVKCLNCSNTLTSPQVKYCCLPCQKDFQYIEYIRKWKLGEVSGNNAAGASETVRRYLFEKYENKCCECGWNKVNSTTGRIPLEVDHINGNWKDNREENLRLICPNCHSLSPNFRGLNKGFGRHKEFRERGLSVYTKPKPHKDK